MFDGYLLQFFCLLVFAAVAATEAKGEVASSELFVVSVELMITIQFHLISLVSLFFCC